jgi:zinc protease
MQIEQKRLKNDLEVLFINSPGSTAASVQIWFRAGSALEENKDQGIAHFLEHMFFKGTEKRPGAAIAHEVESFGGEINAFTSFDYTCYYINTPNTNLNQTVEILMDMVSNPQFKEEELVPERDVVFEEYRRAYDNSTQYNFAQIQKNSFMGKYAHQILGTEKTIKSFSREQLTQFREKFYNLNNAMLVVAGDLKNQAELEKQINGFKLPSGHQSSFPKFKLKNKSNTKAHHKDVRQTSITFTIEAPDYMDDSSSHEDLAVNCLAYGEMSPLYRRLVTETNLASSVSGSTMYFNHGGIHFLKFTFPEENFNKVLVEAKKVIKAVLKQKIKEEDVNRIKNQYVASKIYEKESLESFAFSLGHGFAQNGNIYCEDEFIQKIKNTYSISVNSGLTKLLEKTMHATIQVPRGVKDLKNLETKVSSFIEDINKIAVSASSSKRKEKTQGSDFDPEVKMVEIKKGISLVYRKSSMTPTFVLHTYLKGGLAHETEENNGAYHLLARMMHYGPKGLSFEKLKYDLETKSSYLHGFSGKNACGLTLHGQSEHFDELIEHFTNTLINPSLPANYFKLEKELIKRTLENQKEDPVKQCFKELNKLVFNKHPYSMDVIGSLQSTKKITRKKLQELHEQTLNNNKLVITYCGDLDYELVKQKLQSLFDALPARSTKKSKKRPLKPLNGKKISIEFAREQTHIFIGKPAYKTNTKEDLYLKMLSTHLSGQSSDLFVEVRDRMGLCYAVQPVHHTALEAGYWGIYIGAGHDKKDMAIIAIKTIIGEIQKNGFTKEEFDRVKKMMDGQNLLNVQTIDDYANFYSIPVLHDLGLDFQHHSFQQIRDFNHKDFNKFLAEYLDTEWNQIEVGPN